MIAHDNKYSYHHLDQHKGSRSTGFSEKKWDFPPTKVENKNVMFFVCLGDNDYDDIDTDAVSDHGRNDPRTRTRTKKTMM